MRRKILIILLCVFVIVSAQYYKKLCAVGCDVVIDKISIHIIVHKMKPPDIIPLTPNDNGNG